MGTADSKVAGALVFVADAQFIIALVVAEAFYPGYSISQNYISDLGATCRATCQIVQPTSIIFNSSVIILGVLVIVGAYFIERAFHGRLPSVLIGLTGFGAIGVGVFPETTGVAHHIFSLIAFVFAALSAIASYRLEKSPLSYFSTVLGIMTLGALALYLSNIFLGLGPGGMERMIVYPSLLWAMGFGGYLLAASAGSKTTWRGLQPPVETRKQAFSSLQSSPACSAFCWTSGSQGQSYPRYAYLREARTRQPLEPA